MIFRNIIRMACAGAVLCSFLLFSGCATVPVSEKPARVESLLARLEQGDAESNTRLTHVPFVLDGEIMATRKDARLMWENLAGISGLFSDPEIERIYPAGPEEYGKFAGTADMRVFFDRALPENTTVVEVETSFGSFLLLVSGKRFGVPVLVGLKGPVQ